MWQQIIPKDQSLARRPPRRNDGAGVKDGVVLDGEVVDPSFIDRAVIAIYLKRYSGPIPALLVYFFEQVVRDPHSPSHHTWKVVVRAVHVEATADATDDVIREGHVLDDRPGGRPVLVANGEEDRIPGLPHRPAVLEDVAVNQDALRVLQLEEVLDAPGSARVARIADPPREGLEAVVATELDVRRHEIGDARVGAAEDEILSGALEIVVDDLERAGAIPAADGLGLRPLIVAVGDVRVNLGGRGAVERDAAPQRGRRAAVDIEPVQDQVTRHLGQRRCVITELDQTGGSPDAGRHGEFQPDKTEVMRAVEGFHRRLAVWSDDLGQGAGISRCDARAWRRKTVVRGRSANDDPIASGFGRKSEITSVSGAGLKRNDVARLRLIDRRLKVAGRRHGDGPSGGRRIGCVDEDAWELGQGAGRTDRRRYASGHALDLRCRKCAWRLCSHVVAIYRHYDRTQERDGHRRFA